MKDKRLAFATCIGIFASMGCAERLTPHTAGSVFDDWLQVRRQSGMLPLNEGLITIPVGTLHGADDGNHCALQSQQPTELTDLMRYDRAGILHLDHPEPCKWEVTLSPQAERDVLIDGKLRPPTPTETHSVSIILSRWGHLEVKEIDQQGVRADVNSVSSFPFTGTMKQLARANVLSPLEAGCSFDLRGAQVICEKKLTMAFVDGRWQIESAGGYEVSDRD